jgi:hypothetical protein
MVRFSFAIVLQKYKEEKFTFFSTKIKQTVLFTLGYDTINDITNTWEQIRAAGIASSIDYT